MEVRIIRSAGRTSTVSAREVEGYLQVRAPAEMPDAELAPIVERLQKRLERRRTRSALDGAELEARAQALNRQYFEGALRWTSIAWVTNQDHRWGSCTPSNGTIRLSHRLAAFPGWVLDAVIVHELAHLLEAPHNERFWTLANRYPLTERARGYLIAMSSEAQEGEM